MWMHTRRLLLLATLSLILALDCEAKRRPSIMVVLLARNKEHTLPYFLTQFQQLDYPKDRMVLYVRADHCQDKTITIMEDWLADQGKYYLRVDVALDRTATKYPNEPNPSYRTYLSSQAIIKLKEDALLKARELEAEYLWYLDMDVMLTNRKTVDILLSKKEVVVAPMLDSFVFYSNFCFNMSKSYTNKYSEEYIEIVERDTKGCFKVPMVFASVLIHLKAKETNQLTFNPENISNLKLKVNDTITFTESAKLANINLMMCNDNIYGFFPPPVERGEEPGLDQLRVTSLKLEALANEQPLEVSPLLQKYVPSLPKKDKMTFDEIYIVNLERRPERKTYMERCLDILGLEAKFVKAVDGKMMTDEQIEEKVTFVPGYEDPVYKRSMTPGEVGNFLSHLSIWREVVEKGYNKVLIFEDDIKFEPFFRKRLLKAMKFVEKSNLDYDVIYVGRAKNREEDELWVDDGEEILTDAQYSYGNYGYILNKQGATKLLAAKPLENILPADEYFNIMANANPNATLTALFPERNMKAFSVEPLLVHPRFYVGEKGFVSDTDESLTYVEEDIITPEQLNEDPELAEKIKNLEPVVVKKWTPDFQVQDTYQPRDEL